METNSTRVIRATRVRIRGRFLGTDLSIRFRLTACFALIVLLMIAADLVAVWQYRQIEVPAQLVSKTDRMSVAIVRVHLDVDTFRDSMAALVSSHDTRQFSDEAASIRMKFLRDVDSAEQMLTATPEIEQDAHIASALDSLRMTLLSQLDTAVQLATAGEWNAIRLRQVIQIPAVIDFSSLLVERVDRQAQQQQRRAIEDAEKARQRLFLIVPVAALLTLLAAGALGWYVTRMVTGPLSLLIAGAEALAVGDFQHKVDVRGDNELAILGNAFNYAAQQLQKLYEDIRRSERELRDFVNAVPAALAWALPNGRIEFANRCWAEFIGLPLENTFEWNWESLVHPGDLPSYVSRWRAALESGTPLEAEMRFRRADGKYCWFLDRNVPLRDERGNIIKWIRVGFDIEDRKRAEALLAHENHILEMVAKGESLSEILNALCLVVEEFTERALASILLLDGDRVRHGASPGLPKEYTNAIDGALIGPSAGSCGTAAYRREQVIVEDIAIDPLWADYRDLVLCHSLRACWSTPIFSSGGEVIATFAMYYREPHRPDRSEQEIIRQAAHLAGIAIERKLTQDVLRRNEAYLAEAQKISHIGSFAFNPKTHSFLYWSEEDFRIWGFDPKHGIPDREMTVQRLHPEDRDRVLKETSAAMSTGGEYSLQSRILLPDGTIKHIHSLGHPILSSSGELVEVVGAHVDITERKMIEDTLRQREAYLAEAQRLTHTGSWAFSPTLERMVYWSEETFRIFALDPQLGPPTLEEFRKRIHPEDRERVNRVRVHLFREKLEYLDDYRVLLPDGAVKHVHVIGHPVLDTTGHITEYIGTVVDVTDRKRAEAERERLHQLEADLAHINRVSMMGELSASIAHELNQPITAAITNANTCLLWLKRDQPDLEEAQEAAARAVMDGNRAAETINRMRSFYKKGAPAQPELVDVGEIIREMTALLRSEAARWSISVHLKLADCIPNARADRVQLQQVFMNLMLNAIEAMRETGGNLEISMQVDHDKRLLIAVSDTGVGLPAAKANMIFDAFFTTKPQGTGMGLAITRSIIEAHGGRLWATDNPGRGATFQFTLPPEGATQA